MREVDAGPLAEAIEARKNGQQADAARLHLAEQWREKLLSAAEADVEDLLAAFPCPMPKPRDARNWKNCWPKPARKMTGGRPTPAAPSSGASCVCWNSVREFFWQGEGAPFEKGSPFPLHSHPP